MAMDMFMKLSGIKGESRDKSHKEEIDVLAWSWGMSNSGTAHIGGGAGAGKANFQDISFTKYIDLSSPKLMLHCANGGHIDEAVLTIRKAGTNPLEYIVITMKECMITSLSTGGSGGEDRLTENVTINFAQVAVAYKAQNAQGGAAGGDDFKWNIAENASE